MKYTKNIEFSMLTDPTFKAALALEHKTWPVNNDDELDKFGEEDVIFLAKRFSHLKIVQDFDLNEALYQFRYLKRETRHMAFFRHSNFTQFWEHAIAQFSHGNVTVYSEFLKVVLPVLMIILDTSCCERGFSLMN